jgi:hypothetical protein
LHHDIGLVVVIGELDNVDKARWGRADRLRADAAGASGGNQPRNDKYNSAISA